MPPPKPVPSLQYLAQRASSLFLVETCIFHGFLKSTLENSKEQFILQSTGDEARQPIPGDHQPRRPSGTLEPKSKFRKPILTTNAYGDTEEILSDSDHEYEGGVSADVSQFGWKDLCPEGIEDEDPLSDLSLNQSPGGSECDLDSSRIRKIKRKVDLLASRFLAKLKTKRLSYDELLKDIEQTIANIRLFYIARVPQLLRNVIFNEVIGILMESKPKRNFLYLKFYMPFSLYEIILSVVYDDAVTVIDMSDNRKKTSETVNRYLGKGGLENILVYYMSNKAHEEIQSFVVYPVLSLFEIRSSQMHTLTYLDCGRTPRTPDLIWAVGCSCPNMEHLILNRCEWRNRIHWYHAFWALVGETVPTKTGKPVGCKRLRSLHLHTFFKSFLGFSLIIVRMLKFMPDLEVITGAPMLLALRQYILSMSYGSDLPPPLTLKKFHDMTLEVLCTPITGEEKKILLHVLKNVDEVEVHFLYNEMEEFLMCFPNVSRFTFHVFRDVTRCPCIQSSMDRLKSLQISMGSLECSEAHNILRYLHSAPLLQEVKLILGLNGNVVDVSHLPPCPSLHTLEIYRASGRQHLAFVTNIVAKCPRLQVFRTTFSWHTTPADMDAWVCATVPHIPNVSEVAFEYDGTNHVTFSRVALEVLLASCPRLRRVCLFDPSLCRELAHRAQQHNWDLEIVFAS
ncbi:uncharacterized protein LOC143019604 [Oratosquilla oratoria]|uniref:uncharacterized protein LOC143019604 n=1 Tax=Oratosquilla oratoria TaxID=337810 RepID=UPI003F75E607